MDTLQPAQPSSYRQIIGLSLRLYKKCFTKVILLSIFMAVVVFIPRLLSLAIGEDFLKISPLNIQRLWFIIIEVIAFIFLIGIIWRMHCVLVGRKDKLAQDLNIGVHKVISVFIAGIVQSFIIIAVCILVYSVQLFFYNQQLLFNNNLLSMILTVLTFFLSLFAILYVATLFIFLVPLIAVENCHIFEAIRKSVSLAWNHWWRVFSVQITPWLSYFILLLIIRYAFGLNIHIYFMVEANHTLLVTLIHMLVFALYIPFIAAVMVVQLNDLEIRNQIAKQNA